MQTIVLTSRRFAGPTFDFLRRPTFDVAKVGKTTFQMQIDWTVVSNRTAYHLTSAPPMAGPATVRLCWLLRIRGVFGVHLVCILVGGVMAQGKCKLLKYFLSVFLWSFIYYSFIVFIFLSTWCLSAQLLLLKVHPSSLNVPYLICQSLLWLEDQMLGNHHWSIPSPTIVSCPKLPSSQVRQHWLIFSWSMKRGI